MVTLKMNDTVKIDDDGEPPQPWFKRIFSKKNNTEHNTRNGLINTIRRAYKTNLIADDALSMLEGVLQVEDLQAEDIMIPRSQIRFIHRDGDYRAILKSVLEAGHSRYPVIDENRDDIDGILHAKDLLKYIGKEETFDIDDILRRPVFATENTRLNELLTHFKKSRNHMAIILDEYTSICGIVTMEDVLEQIVGEIDDEHDNTDNVQNIAKTENHFTVKATTPIEEFNEYFNRQLYTEQFDTIGGFISHKVGRIPRTGDFIDLDGLHFKVINSDGRRIHTLQVKHLANTPTLEDKAA